MTPTPAAALQLPRADPLTPLNRAIVRDFPGSRRIDVAEGCSSEYQKGIRGGDFNGDGRRDYVLKLRLRTGQMRIVAAIAQAATFRIHTLSPEARLSEAVGVARRGTAYRTILRDGTVDPGATKVLPLDAPFVAGCETDGRTGYLFRSGRFVEVFPE
ncbi:MAG TPA: hypothetical protein VFP12_10170 [Allosphingosinicella sp.]|nr:hypothetical protein [Allosphingosinicella sp.]